MAKAWGHLCHSGTELEIAERGPKLNFSNSITFASSELVLRAPPGAPRCPCGWLLCFLCAFPFPSEGIDGPKGLRELQKRGDAWTSTVSIEFKPI